MGKALDKAWDHKGTAVPLNKAWDHKGTAVPLNKAWDHKVCETKTAVPLINYFFCSFNQSQKPLLFTTLNDDPRCSFAILYAFFSIGSN
jgi:hypothetical protein